MTEIQAASVLQVESNYIASKRHKAIAKACGIGRDAILLLIWMRTNERSLMQDWNGQEAFVEFCAKRFKADRGELGRG